MLSNRSTCSLVMTVTILLGFAATRCPGDEPAEAEIETVEVKARALILHVPSTWEKQQPKSSLRLTQFRLPAAKGDKEPGELAVFSFGGGDVRANVRRWTTQFQPKNRQLKITTGEAKQGKYLFVELSGTYKKPVGPPIQGNTVDAPGYRVLAVILAIPQKGNYYLKAVGPDATITSHALGLRNAIGADKEKEKSVTAPSAEDDTDR